MSELRKGKDVSDHDRTTVEVGTHAVGRDDDGYATAPRKLEDASDHDYTTVELGRSDAAAGYVTAINAPFSGTPTPVAAVGPISSGEITAQNSRTAESASPPTDDLASNPDPTNSTKLDPGFIHLVAGTLVDAYEVEKLLGAGGMGAVYGARHERLGRRAAIKVISPRLSRDRDAVERFEQEAQVLARISHPNIVGVHNVGTLPGDGRVYYIMEWLDGEALQSRLDRGAIGFGLALYVLDQIARGLEVAHGAGIVHRDLKPDNVWLQHVADDPRPIVKILDWGLAKLVQHQRSEHTAANVMFGTTAYMSPEQCRSTRDVGPATDVYALGCIAYELLCGRLPFTYDNTAELVAAHLSEAPPRPVSLNPSLDPSLDMLLATMLAKDLTQRPTLARVRRVIADALASPMRTPVPNPPTNVAQPRAPSPVALVRSSAASVDRPQAPRRVFVALAGLVVLGVVIAAAVARSGPARLDQPRRDTDQPRSAIEIDASIAPTAISAPNVPLDTNPPVASAAQVDAGDIPRAKVDPDSPPLARHLPDSRAQGSEPTVVAQPATTQDAVDTAPLDASVAPDDRDVSIEDAPPVKPTTSPSADRMPVPVAKKPPNQDATPPAPAPKKPPTRNVIFDPFKKKERAK